MPTTARKNEKGQKVYTNPDTGAEYVSRARDISEFPDAEDILPDLANESREIAEKIKLLDKRRKEIGADIGSILDILDYPSISGDGWVVVKSSGGGTPSISPELLLKNGVSLAIIKKCTVYSDKYEYVQVRGLGNGSTDFSKGR